MKFINLKNKNMPNFNVDIDIDDFISSCSSYDIKILIKALEEDGYLEEYLEENNTPVSTIENEFNDIINKISDNRLLLTNEEEEILRKISNRF